MKVHYEKRACAHDVSGEAELVPERTASSFKTVAEFARIQQTPIRTDFLQIQLLRKKMDFETASSFLSGFSFELAA
jgi:hypothetical protein